MNEREIKNRIKIIKQQLFLIHEYHEYFESILGKKGVERFINNSLDELLHRREQLKNLEH